MPTTEIYLLYILLGTIAGMLYSLRRIVMLETRIVSMEANIMNALKGRRKVKRRKVKRKR